MDRRKVTVSHHAVLRINERILDKLGYPTIEQLAIAARYKGEPISPGRRHSRVVKTLFQGYVFIFQLTAHSWNLITTYKYQKEN